MRKIPLLKPFLVIVYFHHGLVGCHGEFSRLAVEVAGAGQGLDDLVQAANISGFMLARWEC
jgi:hypothetical protein